MTDHLRPPAGRLDVFNDIGQIVLHSEGHLRDGITALAWLAGWNVATEVQIPNGGRADIVLTFPGAQTHVIECKLALTTTRQIRLGFQQADGYRRFYGSGIGCRTFLVARRIDYDAAGLIDAAYDQVELVSIERLLLNIRLADIPTFGARLNVARRRQGLLGRVQTQSTATTDEMVRAWRQHLIVKKLMPQYEAWAFDLLREIEAAA